jgi:hypothetical protein
MVEEVGGGRGGQGVGRGWLKGSIYANAHLTKHIISSEGKYFCNKIIYVGLPFNFHQQFSGFVYKYGLNELTKKLKDLLKCKKLRNVSGQNPSSLLV